MSQVTLSTTTTTPLVTVMCLGASLIMTTVTLDPTFVGQTTLGQHIVALSPKLILRNTVRGFDCLNTVLQ